MAEQTQTIAPDPAEAGMRLDAWLAGRPELALSRSQAARLIAAGHVRLLERAGRPEAKVIGKPSHPVAAGDRYHITVPAPEPLTLAPEPIALDVLYEDADVIVVNKARGMVVHPAAGHSEGTLVHALLHHCQDLQGIGGTVRPGIVHRLDKDTTGCVMVAKNEAAQLALTQQLKARTVTREYVALTWGAPRDDEGTIDAPIGRHPVDRKRMAVLPPGRGREAVTHFRVEERLAGHGLLRCRLETGRTHQIRVHLAAIGHPVVGDRTYGGKRTGYGLAGQALHAQRLVFRHPRTGAEVACEAPLPTDFAGLLDRLRAGRA